MSGNDIPLVTFYRIGKDGKTDSFKKPKYVLKSTAEIKAEQDRLGDGASWYYGTECEKCCGVYPAFMTDDGFKDLGYYVCLVCGKESEHEPMTWSARDAWNDHRYRWEPTGYQMSIFDLIGAAI